MPKKKSKKTEKNELYLPPITSPSDVQMGEVVWAKYKNFPYWPGYIDCDPETNNSENNTTIISNNRRSKKNKKKSSNTLNNNETNTITLTICWFGDYNKISNQVNIKYISKWDLVHKNDIYQTIANFDKLYFHESCDLAMNIHKEICYENGIPIDINGCIIDSKQYCIKKPYFNNNNNVSNQYDSSDGQFSNRPSNNQQITKKKKKVEISKKETRTDVRRSDRLRKKRVNSEYDTITAKVNNKKRKLRQHKSSSDEEDDDDEDSDMNDDSENENKMNELSINECMKYCRNAFELISDTHSAEDITPFIALTYYGVKGYVCDNGKKKNSVGDEKIMQGIAKMYDIKENDVKSHLDYFSQECLKPKKKKRRK